MMGTKKSEFLKLAILEQMKYADITARLNVDQKTLSLWWEELKPEREKLSALHQLWRKKCKTADFHEFKTWFESTERKCHYCEITEREIEQLIQKNMIETKRLRTRGRRLEIDRVSPNRPYDDLSNLVFCCYWCNNAKTDEFTAEEFKPIGDLIRQIWQRRLRSDKFISGGEGIRIIKKR